MKFVFLTLNKVFDYSQIGGTDSFMRRLASSIYLQDTSHEIEWIFYGSERQHKKINTPYLTSSFFITFHDALGHILRKGYSNVIATYIAFRDRITYALFRRKHTQIIFHSLIFFYPESGIKRFIKFSEYALTPYNGKIFCVSHRQQEYLKKYSLDSILLLPAVPDDYFHQVEKNGCKNKINITFIGRIDPRKGIMEVIELFEALSGNNKFELNIYGIHIREDRMAFEIHKNLADRTDMNYTVVNRQDYSEAVDEMVCRILADTDIFVQPYTSLESTVDTPLLLLEAMASKCAVLTTNIGNIPTLYGKSSFLMDQSGFVKNALNLLNSLSTAYVQSEKKRVGKQIDALGVRVTSFAKNMTSEVHI